MKMRRSTLRYSTETIAIVCWNDFIHGHGIVRLAGVATESQGRKCLALALPCLALPYIEHHPANKAMSKKCPWTVRSSGTLDMVKSSLNSA